MLGSKEFCNVWDKLEEAWVSLFNSDEFIDYEEMKIYFNKIFFNSGRKTLLPEKDDVNGWLTLENMRTIEQNIPRWKKENGKWVKCPSGGLARVCFFYNTYVIESRVNKDRRVRFYNKDKSPEEVERINFEHNYFHPGKGSGEPDFMYKDDEKELSFDIKFKNVPKCDETIEEFSNHNADYIVVYNYFDETLNYYIKVEPWDRKTYKFIRKSECKDIKNNLIPPEEYNKSIYKSWDKIFKMRES